jgi:hypothetical protein
LHTHSLHGPRDRVGPTLREGEKLTLAGTRRLARVQGFVVDASNRASVVRICQRLDDYLGFLAAGSRIAVPASRSSSLASEYPR